MFAIDEKEKYYQVIDTENESVLFIVKEEDIFMKFA